MEQTAKVVGLGAIDRIVLVAAWLVSCSAVYGLGFYTGSQTQDRLRDDEERVVRLPISEEPPPVGERAKAADDLNFWGVLESGGRRSKPGDGIPVQRPQATAAVEPAAPDEPDRHPAKPQKSRGETVRPSRSSAAAGKAGPAKTSKTTTKAKTGASKAPARRSGGGTASKPATVGTSATARPAAPTRAKAPATRPDAREKPRAPQPAAGATPAADKPNRGTPGSTAVTPRSRTSGAGGRERAAVARSGVPPE